MLKNIIPIATAAIILFSFPKVRAQEGLHIQQFSYSNFQVFNADSVYMPVDEIGAPALGNFKKMAVIDPKTNYWKYVNTVDYTNYLGPFVMKNKMEGVMIYSSQNKVFRTIDGWLTMTQVPNVAAGYGFTQIANTANGYVGYEGTLKKLFFSADGLTWTQKASLGSGVPMLRSFGSQVLLYNGSTTTAISNDGGQSYSSVTFNQNFTGGQLKEVKIFAKDTFLIATDLKYFMTLDGGTTWSEKSFPTAIGTITFKNRNEFFVTTDNSSYYTANGGDTWEMKGKTPDRPKVYIGKSLYAWPSHKSDDNGITWKPMFSGSASNPIYDVRFNGSTGMIGRSASIVDFSYDKGRTISRRDTVTGSDDIMAVKILNNGDLIAGDRLGQIFYSNDNGTTWIKKLTNTSNFNAVKFSTSADENTIVMTRLGQPVVSSDHGKNFAVVSVGGGAHAQTVKPDGEILDAGGGDFDITTAVYKSWEISRFSPTGSKTILESIPMNGESLSEIHMTDNTTGFLITWDEATKVNRVYKTTNGWAGGSKLISSIDPVIAGLANYQSNSRIQTFGLDTIVLTSNGNKYYHKSSNGGRSWTKFDLAIYPLYATIHPSLKKSHFFGPDEYIMALNNSGMYLNISSNNTSVVSAINDEENIFDRPMGGQALSIYPNPAKNSISIYHASLRSGDIAVMDFTGRVLLEKKNFMYDELLDISSIPTGMYILSVKNSGENPISVKFLKQ